LLLRLLVTHYYAHDVLLSSLVSVSDRRCCQSGKGFEV
jgi:hypothetical protein